MMKAISYHDPHWLPSNATKNKLQFNVAVSDVTFGITSPRSGVSKWSLITLLTPGHEAFVVVASAITQEDTVTFMNEMDVLLDLYPRLKYDNWVLIFDGDPAKLKAARIKFERVRIILCLYHATENIKNISDACVLQQTPEMKVIQRSAQLINRCFPNSVANLST